MEEPRSEDCGERALREQRYGCDGRGEMAERVGQRDVAAELRDEAEADERPERTMAGDVERRAQQKSEHEKKNCAGDRREAKEDERAGVRADVFGGEQIHGEARGGDQRHEVAGAKV